MRGQSPAQELKEAESLLRSHEKAEREINVTLQRVEVMIIVFTAFPLTDGTPAK